MVDRVGVNVQHRTCSKCGISKPETEEFFRKRGTKDRGGLRPDCRDCSAERDRLFYERNKARDKAKRAAYRARTKAEIYERDRRYLATPEGWATRVAANNRWRAKNPEMAVLASQKRRAAKSGVGADFTRAQWDTCRDAFQHHCAYCDEYRPLTQEHVIALSVGGLHTASNVIPACKSCNSRKFRTPMEQWFRAQSFFSQARLDFIYAYTERLSAAAA